MKLGITLQLRKAPEDFLLKKGAKPTFSQREKDSRNLRNSPMVGR
jgi:hypothetical protein